MREIHRSAFKLVFFLLLVIFGATFASYASNEPNNYGKIGEWDIQISGNNTFCSAANWSRAARLGINVGKKVNMFVFLPDDKWKKSKFQKGKRVPISLNFSDGTRVKLSVLAMEKVMFLIDDDLDNIITAAMNSDSLYIPEFKGLYDLSSFAEAARMSFKCSKLLN